jgi:hypothetical protein
VNLKKVRQGLITVALFIVVVYMLFYTIQPLIPYVIAAIIMVGIIGFIFGRRRL